MIIQKKLKRTHKDDKDSKIHSLGCEFAVWLHRLVLPKMSVAFLTLLGF